MTPRPTDCPVCTNGREYRDVTTRWGVRIVRCTGCGMVFANPQPDAQDLESYYSPEYFEKNADKFLQFPIQRDVELRFRRYLGEVEKVCPRDGKVLDVGCGTGLFLWIAREAGFDVQGQELSPFASELGREKLGLDIRTGRLEEADPSSRFQAVTMWDFLEHTPDPVDTLRAARRVLADDGHLLMTVPHVGSWWARLMGKRWVGFEKASEHLYYFTRNSLRGLLERAGFEPLKVEPHAWVCTAEFLARRGGRVWPWGGRVLGGTLKKLGQDGRVIRFPSVNLLAVARKAGGAGS